MGYKSLDHLSKEELLKLRDLYFFSDLTVKEILKNYNLDFNSTRLCKLLPPVELDAKCECCGENMQMQGVSRQYYKNRDIYRDYIEEHTVCPKCGHKLRRCRCSYCQEKEHLAKEQLKVYKRKQKYDFIQSLCVEPKSVNEAGVVRFFITMLFVYHLQAKNAVSAVFPSLIFSPLSENPDLISYGLTSLVRSGVIKPDANQRDSAFAFNQKNELAYVYVERMTWIPNLDADCTGIQLQDFSDYMYDHFGANLIMKLWYYAQALSVLDYILYRMEQEIVRYEVNDVEKYLQRLIWMLQEFSRDELLYFAYISVKSFKTWKASKGLEGAVFSAKSSIGHVLKFMENRQDYVRNGNSKAKKYSIGEEDSLFHQVCDILQIPGEGQSMMNPELFEKIKEARSQLF